MICIYWRNSVYHDTKIERTPHGSVAGFVPFNIYMNDRDRKCALCFLCRCFYLKSTLGRISSNISHIPCSIIMVYKNNEMVACE